MTPEGLLPATESKFLPRFVKLCSQKLPKKPTTIDILSHDITKLFIELEQPDNPHRDWINMSLTSERISFLNKVQGADEYGLKLPIHPDVLRISHALQVRDAKQEHELGIPYGWFGDMKQPPDLDGWMSWISIGNDRTKEYEMLREKIERFMPDEADPLLDVPTKSPADDEIGIPRGHVFQMKNTRWFDAITKLTRSVKEMPCIGARASSFLKVFHKFLGIDRRVMDEDNAETVSYTHLTLPTILLV